MGAVHDAVENCISFSSASIARMETRESLAAAKSQKVAEFSAGRGLIQQIMVTQHLIH